MRCRPRTCTPTRFRRRIVDQRVGTPRSSCQKVDPSCSRNRPCRLSHHGIAREESLVVIQSSPAAPPSKVAASYPNPDRKPPGSPSSGSMSSNWQDYLPPKSRRPSWILALRDRAYLVTGGSGGLGYATAKQLVAEGARVVISGLSPADTAQAVETLGGGDHVVGVAGDNSDPATAEMLVQTAAQQFGRLDGALISVGGPPPGAVMDVETSSGDARSRRFFSARSGSPAPSPKRSNTMAPSRSSSPRPSEHRCRGWRYPTGCARGSACGQSTVR